MPGLKTAACNGTLPGYLQIDVVFEGQRDIAPRFTPKKVEKTQPKR